MDAASQLDQAQRSALITNLQQHVNTLFKQQSSTSNKSMPTAFSQMARNSVTVENQQAGVLT